MVDENIKSDLRYMSSLLDNINRAVQAESINEDELYQARASLHQLLKTGADVYNVLTDASRTVKN